MRSSTWFAAISGPTTRLALGAASGHALTLLALPFVTRLYGPAAFGILAMLTAVIGVLSPAACGRYDLAIPLAHSDRQAAALVILSVLVALVVALALGIMVALFSPEIATLLQQPAFERYLWLVPLGVASAAVFLASQNWVVRQRRFTLLAGTRVVQSAGAAACQLGLGWAGVGAVGLLIGWVTNAALGCAILVKSLSETERSLFAMVRAADVRSAAVEFGRFPRLSVLESLMNSVGIYLPVLIVGATAGMAEAGYVGLAMNLLQVPLVLIGNATGQIFLAEAPEHYRRGGLRPYTQGVMRRILAFGSIPLGALGLAGFAAVPWVFGSGWERAGELIGWMAPWFLLQLVVSPVSSALHITGRLGWAVAVQAACTILRCGSVATAAWAAPAFVSEIYAVSGSAAYLLYLVVVLRAIAAADITPPLGAAAASPGRSG